MNTKLLAAAAVATAAFAIVACGDKDSDSADSGEQADTAAE